MRTFSIFGQNIYLCTCTPLVHERMNTGTFHQVSYPLSQGTVHQLRMHLIDIVSVSLRPVASQKPLVHRVFSMGMGNGLLECRKGNTMWVPVVPEAE